MGALGVGDHKLHVLKSLVSPPWLSRSTGFHPLFGWSGVMYCAAMMLSHREEFGLEENGV